MHSNFIDIKMDPQTAVVVQVDYQETTGSFSTQKRDGSSCLVWVPLSHLSFNNGDDY